MHTPTVQNALRHLLRQFGQDLCRLTKIYVFAKGGKMAYLLGFWRFLKGFVMIPMKIPTMKSLPNNKD